MIAAQYVATSSTPTCASPPTGAALLTSSRYAYDIGGNVYSDYEFDNAASAGANGLWTYSYDGADRLANATPPPASGGGSSTIWPAQVYTYDGAGNRVKVVGSGTTNGNTCTATCTTSYDDLGHPATYSSGGTTTLYCYDGLGDMVHTGVSSGASCSSPSGSGMTTYTFDNFSRMTGATTAAGTATYVYDALSRLSSTTVGSQTTNLTYQGITNNIVSSVGAATTYFDYSPFGPLAQDSVKDGSVPAAFFLKDLHGDVISTSNASGSQASSWVSYSPWREIVGSSTGGSSPTQPYTLGFQGQLSDPTTGFTKTATRFYNPAMGAFTAGIRGALSALA